MKVMALTLKKIMRAVCLHFGSHYTQIYIKSYEKCPLLFCPDT